MAEEILLQTRLNKDRLNLAKNDHEVAARLDIEPSPTYRNRYNFTACDLCMVLDGSGSMDEPFSAGSSVTKREGVIAAARAVVAQLQPDDTLSLVAYDSSAHLLAEGLKATEQNRIFGYIDDLRQFTGGTNFEKALDMAGSTLKKRQNPSKRIIFLTDGNDTMSDAQKVIRLITDLSSQNVVIDCLGMGADFNFHFMRGMSSPSNGRTFLLSNPDEAAMRFEELLVSGQKVIANKVFLTVLFDADLRNIEAYQWLPEMRYYGNLKPASDGTTRLEVNVQTLRQDRRNVFFFKFNIDPEPGRRSRSAARIRLDYDLPHEKKANQQDNLNLFINFSDDPDAMEWDSSVDAGFQEVELCKLYEQLESVRKTDWKHALEIIQIMIRRADSIGDQARRSEYEGYKQKLQKDHQLSDADMTRVGSTSSQSTSAAEGYLESQIDMDILNSL
jgi:hypothetical protein